MKRLTFFALTLFSCLASFANVIGDEPTTPPKQVIMRERGTLIEDRTTSSNVYVLLLGDTISIETSSIGAAEVYIVDSFGRTTCYGVADATIGYLVMDTPEIPGNYTIVIWSDTYYGEGQFVIE